MLYCIISTEPVLYIKSESKELLNSDYHFIIENPDLFLSKLDAQTVAEYNELSFSQLKEFLDGLKNSTGTLTVYTINGSDLISREYAEPVYLYPDMKSWDMPTYAPDESVVTTYYSMNPEELKKLANTTLVLNRKKDVYDRFNSDKYFPDTLRVTTECTGFTDKNIIGYVCIPITTTSVKLSNADK